VRRLVDCRAFALSTACTTQAPAVEGAGPCCAMGSAAAAFFRRSGVGRSKNGTESAPRAGRRRLTNPVSGATCGASRSASLRSTSRRSRCARGARGGVGAYTGSDRLLGKALREFKSDGESDATNSIVTRAFCERSLKHPGHLSNPESRLTKRFLAKTEGEGFEPSIRLTTDNGFRDRRIRPLCHPSGLGTG
jgi:hypothetical protein